MGCPNAGASLVQLVDESDSKHAKNLDQLLWSMTTDSRMCTTFGHPDREHGRRSPGDLLTGSDHQGR